MIHAKAVLARQILKITNAKKYQRIFGTHNELPCQRVKIRQVHFCTESTD